MQIYCGVLFGEIPMRAVLEEREVELWCTSSAKCRALDLRWLFRVLLNWGRGAGPCTSHGAFIWCGLSLERGHTLGWGSSLQSRTFPGETPVVSCCIKYFHTWGRVPRSLRKSWMVHPDNFHYYLFASSDKFIPFGNSSSRIMVGLFLEIGVVVSRT